MVDTDRLDDANIATLDAERLDARLLHRLDEDRRAAVHDGHFAAVDFDDRIVDAERIKGGHDMLDRRDRTRRREAEHGAQVGGTNRGRHGLQFGHIIIRTDALENDAGAGFGWIEGCCDFCPGMNTDTPNRKRALKRRLETQKT